MGQDAITSAGRVPAFTPLRRCSGCGRCVAACPEKLYSLEADNHRKQSVLGSVELCSRCGRCVQSCPLDVITIETVSP